VWSKLNLLTSDKRTSLFAKQSMAKERKKSFLALTPDGVGEEIEDWEPGIRIIKLFFSITYTPDKLECLLLAILSI
jgi:hypothetical protein